MVRRRTAYILVATVVLVLITAFVSAEFVRRMPAAPGAVRSLVVFVAAKLVGDALSLAFWPRSGLFFFEDVARQYAGWCLLAVFASAVAWLAERFIGGAVDPAIPAVGAYLVSAWLEERR